MSLYYNSTLSSQTVCLLCHYAGQAGMPAEVAQYGRRPGTSHSHCARHLQKKLGFETTADKLYKLPVPAYRKHDLSRSSHDLHCLPLHEAVVDAAEGDRALEQKLEDAISNGELPPPYTTHPGVEGWRDHPLPLALYVDGLPYTITDSVVGFWVINLITNTRVLLSVVRKRLSCQCGCRGWCTFHPVLCFLRWSLHALYHGVWPHARHDGSAWGATDSIRAAKAGTPMRRAVLVQLRGDWMEFCERLGLPNWSSGLRPCFLCAAHAGIWFDVRGVGLRESRWHINTDDDVDRACAACEVHIQVSAGILHRIRPYLRFDKRKKGSHGLALTHSFPDLGLMAGDRVEPSDTLRDVGSLLKNET